MNSKTLYLLISFTICAGISLASGSENGDRLYIGAHIMPQVIFPIGDDSPRIAQPPGGWIGINSEYFMNAYSLRLEIGEGNVSSDSFQVSFSTFLKTRIQQFSYGIGLAYFHLMDSAIDLGNSEESYDLENSINTFVSLRYKFRRVDLFVGYRVELNRSRRGFSAESCSTNDCEDRKLVFHKNDLFLNISFDLAMFTVD